MESIRLLDLGLVPPIRLQTIYHAVGYALDEGRPDTLILVAPTEPYVCQGFHQELDKEIDLEFCRTHGLPAMRADADPGRKGQRARSDSERHRRTARGGS